MSQLEIVISSPPDRELLVAEIFFDSEQFAELNREAGEIVVEIYPRRDGRPWILPPQQIAEALEKAQSALVGR